MSEILEWKQSYQIGVEEVDYQHRYFAMLINRLGDELTRCEDNAYNVRLLEELCKYASFHFISEENLMYRLCYPDLKEHKEFHYKLVNQLNNKINFYKLSQLTRDDVLEFLIDWFVHHTLNCDKKIGQFVLEEL